jgi:hypothetical protein
MLTTLLINTRKENTETILYASEEVGLEVNTEKTESTECRAKT